MDYKKLIVDTPCVVLIGEHFKGYEMMANGDPDRLIYMRAPFEIVEEPEHMQTKLKKIINFTWDATPENYEKAIKQCLDHGYVLISRILNLPNDKYDVELDGFLEKFDDVKVIQFKDEDYPADTFIENLIEIKTPVVTNPIES